MVGRYPFLAIANRYLESSGLAESTRRERERRLRRIDKDLRCLLAEGKIDTTNPEKMGEKEVSAFMDLIIGRGLKGKTLEHEVTALGLLLRFANNTAMDVYKATHQNQLRKRNKVDRLPPLTKVEFNSIVYGAERVNDDNWSKMESYAMVVLSIGSGVRHKELREGLLWDLTLEPGNERYHVRHPKGEDTYGDVRDPPIRPECVLFLKRYLRKRMEKISLHPENEFLFPAFRDKKGDGKLADNTIGKMVRWVGENAQVKSLNIQKCRRTYGQFLLDEGLHIEDASVLLGHHSTNTTEKYYCRRKQQQASDSARCIWGKDVPIQTPIPSPVVNSPLIDKSRWDTGYIM